MPIGRGSSVLMTEGGTPMASTVGFVDRAEDGTTTMIDSPMLRTVRGTLTDY